MIPQLVIIFCGILVVLCQENQGPSLTDTEVIPGTDKLNTEDSLASQILPGGGQRTSGLGLSGTGLSSGINRNQFLRNQGLNGLRGDGFNTGSVSSSFGGGGDFALGTGLGTDLRRTQNRLNGGNIGLNSGIDRRTQNGIIGGNLGGSGGRNDIGLRGTDFDLQGVGVGLGSRNRQNLLGGGGIGLRGIQDDLFGSGINDLGLQGTRTNQNQLLNIPNRNSLGLDIDQRQPVNDILGTDPFDQIPEHNLSLDQIPNSLRPSLLEILNRRGQNQNFLQENQNLNCQQAYYDLLQTVRTLLEHELPYRRQHFNHAGLRPLSPRRPGLFSPGAGLRGFGPSRNFGLRPGFSRLGPSSLERDEFGLDFTGVSARIEDADNPNAGKSQIVDGDIKKAADTNNNNPSE